MEVPEFLWHCSRDSEIIASDILEVLLSLSSCRRNVPNYRQNDGLLETCFTVNICSLATLCDILITIRENHWLLRLIWRFSESMSEYESVFRICVWIIIHVTLIWNCHFCNSRHMIGAQTHRAGKVCIFWFVFSPF